MTVRRMVKKMAASFGYDIRRIEIPPKGIPDRALYQPVFSPWLGEEFARYYAIAASRTVLSVQSCYVLYTLAKQTSTLEGDVWECGVYKGGTAVILAKVITESCPQKKLFLFDTFAGLPKSDSARDLLLEGDFSDTSAEAVESFIDAPGVAVLRKGFIPDTFSGLERHKIAIAHIDAGIYKSVTDAIEFVWPKLSVGGFVVFGDYGLPPCPGVRQAVDEFFAETQMRPLCLRTGQAIVFKGF
jgi:O-methyltransferase